MTYKQKSVKTAAFALLVAAGVGAGLWQGAATAQTKTGGAMTAKSGKKVTLSETNDGKTVPVHIGDTVIVQLSSNASTGYSWRPATLTPTGVVTASGASEYVKPKYVPGMVGRPGTQVFRFKALKAGEAKLQLEYRGPGRDADTGAPGQAWGVTLAVTK